MGFCVVNLTHMLQTSSSNQTHVLVASNNISLSCLEGRIYIITLLNPSPVLIILLNPLPVLVALKILQDILSFTRSFMVNSRPLVRCLENSDEKVKQFRVIPRIASSRLAYSSSIQCPKWMCLVLQRNSRSVSRKLSRNRHYGLARMAFISSSVINLVYSCKVNQTRFECSLLF